LKTIRIGNGQAFWGDSALAPLQQVRHGELDYLMLDYLAEVTMSIMQKMRARDPDQGYARDFVPLMENLLPEILDKDVKVVANAGGVTVSYFEWVQNRQGYYWTLEEIHERLKTIMEREGRAIWNHAKQHNVTVRSAAYVHALQRLAQAIEAHGTQNDFAA